MGNKNMKIPIQSSGVKSFKGRIEDVIPLIGDYAAPQVTMKKKDGVTDSNVELEIVELRAEKADLVNGKVPESQLPAYVDEIVEVENFGSLPTAGEIGKIYITLDDNKNYRWSGTTYAQLDSGLALGETSATAYPGDKGKVAYDHTSLVDNPHAVTKEQIGLGSVDDTSDADKPLSEATTTALQGKISRVNGIEPVPSNQEILVPSMEIGVSTAIRLLPSDYIEVGIHGKVTIENALGWVIYGSAVNGLVETIVSNSTVKQIFHATNGFVYDSKSLTSSTWSDWKVRSTGGSFTIRRDPTTIVMANNTAIVFNGTRINDTTLIEAPTTSTIRFQGGRKYAITIMAQYLQTGGSTGSATLQFQLSVDGINWTNFLGTRSISIITDNETIESTVTLLVYPSELTGGFNWTHFRILPSTVNSISYTASLEVREV